ncbi:MAG: nuclear transport factor 2 family protein [Actinomycetota bacterium]|nr:nuclear transport factor 2 family protein [Actinomycetota bacterium]
MQRDRLAVWLGAYERLWRTAGSEGLGEIFAEDVVYSMGPYEQAAKGLRELSELWERERVSPDEQFEISTEIVAVEGDTGVARVDVRYGPPREQEYKDLWVIRLDAEGRCVSFEEWPFWPEEDTPPPAA